MNPTAPMHACDNGQVPVRLRELREAKQLCARRFGEARRSGADVEALKAEMQAITHELDQLEALLKAQRTRSEEQAAPAMQDALPARFRHVPPDVPPPPGLEVVPCGTAEREAAEAYVAAHVAASPWHHAVWRDLITATMGHADVTLLARAGGRVLGVLPLIHMRSRLFGSFAVSLPCFNYGGPLADSLGVETALLDAAAGMLARRGLAHVEIRELRVREGWPARADKVSMILPLPGSAEELDTQLGSKLRAQVQRARREGPEVVFGGAELLDEFYAVFAHNMRDLGTPVYARDFFRAVLAAWPQASTLAVVRLNRRAAGCALLVGHRDVLEIPWASTLRETNPLGLNMLLYREVLGFAMERGYRFFDFGRSSGESGTYRFKRQWGALPVAHHWHYCLPAGHELPRINPDNPKYRLMIGAWQRMPVALTRLLGPWVVRGIP